MYQPLVSLIIPVFNCEKFLNTCIESIQNQTYKNWIAIFVNDGSTDNSKIILEIHAAKDSRIQIINKSNGGAASARNAGLDAVKTPYITMVDADDELTNDALELLMSAATSTNCDMVVAGSCTYNSNNTLSINNLPINGLINNISFILFRHIHRTPYAKLYKKEIIDRYHLRMPEDMIVAEDYVFVTSYWTRCKTVYLISKSIYNYFYSENENSLMHKFMRKELPFKAYLFNAEAPYRTFQFLIATEKNKSAITTWTYELFRDLWKMSNNSHRYIDSKSNKKQIKTACTNHEKEMSDYIPFLKFISMPHRYYHISKLIIKIKKLFNH